MRDLISANCAANRSSHERWSCPKLPVFAFSICNPNESQLARRVHLLEVGKT
jgi:hypothetical protein